MKLLIDENLSPKWEEALTKEGFTATHWMRVGEIGAPDEVILNSAEQNNYIVISQDLDFSRMLVQRNALVPSVIQLRADNPTPEEWGILVLRILKKYAEQIEKGCLITIKPDQHRIRILPIHRKK